jgi:hypothetical protein
MVESRKSTIDSEWTVFIFDEADDSSPKLLFEVYGVAFADLKSKSIFIDDTAVLSQNQILAIEAHEIAHGRLDHENRDIDQITQEKEADWLAHKILTEMSLVTPAQIISDRYSNHYDEDISSQNERMFTILGTVLVK